MPVFFHRFLALIAVLVAVIPTAALAQKEEPKRAIDFFDKVEVTFTADAIEVVGKNPEAIAPPAQQATGRLLLFIPKVRDDAEGFWETSAVRFASMSIKVGDYSFPLRRTSGSLQFIDNRPTRLVIGRAPAGRDAVMPGTQDFALELVRNKRTTNDYQLDFERFSFTLFEEKKLQFVSREGSATLKILEETKNQGKSNVDLGFSFGSSSDR